MEILSFKNFFRFEKIDVSTSLSRQFLQRSHGVDDSIVTLGDNLNEKILVFNNKTLLVTTSPIHM